MDVLPRGLLTITLVLAQLVGLLPAEAAGPGQPGAPGTNANISAPLEFPAPRNVQLARTPAACKALRASVGRVNTDRYQDICDNVSGPTNSAAFTWQWKGNALHPVAGGYYLYRTDSGRHDRVGQTYAAVDGTWAVELGSIPSESCVVVTAWDLSGESGPSEQVCMLGAGDRVQVLQDTVPMLRSGALPAVQPIPSDIRGLYERIYGGLSAANRVKVDALSLRLRPSLFASVRDPQTLTSDTAIANMGLNTGDIEQLAFIVLMDATNAMDADLRMIMDETKAETAKKAALRELAGEAAFRSTPAPSSMEQTSTSLQLQMAMDRRSKFIATLSNMMKTLSNSRAPLIQNLK